MIRFVTGIQEIRPVWAAVFAVISGCVVSSRTRLPADSQVLRDRLVVHSNVAGEDQDPLIHDLVQLRSDMCGLLGLPASEEPVYVYLFRDKGDFDAYSRQKYPELHGRRAFFVDNASGLSVYACWGERVAEDLRHEVAHGYLHAAAPFVPLWLDEGIAEFFEVPATHTGLNSGHVDLLSRAHAAGEWTPNLQRLERLVDPSTMRQVDYAEAWLWVHFCLRTSADRRQQFLDYLAKLRAERANVTFSEQLGPLEQQVVGHLRSLAAG